MNGLIKSILNNLNKGNDDCDDENDYEDWN